MSRVAIIFIGILLVIIGTAVLLKDFYGETIDQTARAVAVNAVATKINKTVREGIYDEELEGPLLTVERDSEGNIVYVEANSRLINKLLMSFSTKMEENYSMSDQMVIPVNLGVLTGSRIMSQLPYTVDIKVMPLSLTKFQCETEFITGGINQTKYKVYCTVISSVQILAPFTEQTAEINRRVLIAEAVIVGRVPDNYVFVPEEDILDVN